MYIARKRERVEIFPLTLMMKNQMARGNSIPTDRSHEYEIIFQKLKRAGVKMAIGTDALYEFMRENLGALLRRG